MSNRLRHNLNEMILFKYNLFSLSFLQKEMHFFNGRFDSFKNSRF